jgi:hypothetical protein
MGAGVGEQGLVFYQTVRRFNRYGAVHPGRSKLRPKIARLKGTPQRLEGAIARIGRHLHPRRLIGAVGPEVLMRIDDEAHRDPTTVAVRPGDGNEGSMFPCGGLTSALRPHLRQLPCHSSAANGRDVPKQTLRHYSITSSARRARSAGRSTRAPKRS